MKETEKIDTEAAYWDEQMMKCVEAGWMIEVKPGVYRLTEEGKRHTSKLLKDEKWAQDLWRDLDEAAGIE